MNKQNIIILAGNSNNNIKWLKEMEKLYQKDYHPLPLNYDHWLDNSEISFDKELNKLKK